MSLYDSSYEDYIHQCFLSTQSTYQADYEDEYAYYQDEEFQDEEQESKINLARKIYQDDLLVLRIVKDCRMKAIESHCMMIVDVDVDCEIQTEKYVDILREYQSVKGGSYRVYKTRGGLRYIRTDILFQGANKSALSILQSLHSDNKYIDMCSKTKTFMARITPKFDDAKQRKQYLDESEQGYESNIAVTKYLETVGDGNVLSILKDVIAIHDFYTKADSSNCKLY